MEELIDNIVEQAKERFAEQVLPFLKEQGEKLLKKVKTDLIPVLKDFLGKIQKAGNSNIVYRLVPSLSQSYIVELAGKNIVRGANQVVAVKNIKDGKTFVYLSYAKDRELLEENDNRFIVIEADSVEDDVNDLFGNESLIILE